MALNDPKTYSDLVLNGLNAIDVLFLTMVLCAVLRSRHILGILMIMVLSDAWMIIFYHQKMDQRNGTKDMDQEVYQDVNGRFVNATRSNFMVVSHVLFLKLGLNLF